MAERLRANRAPIQFLIDLILTELALFLAAALRPSLPFGAPFEAAETHLAPFVYVAVALIWSVVFLLLSAYEPRRRRPADEMQVLFIAVTLSTLALAAVLFFSFVHISRLQVLTFYLLDLAFLAASRQLLRLGLGLAGLAPARRRRVLILGAGEAGRDAAQMIEHHPWAGLEAVGFLDDQVPRGAKVVGHPVLGRVDEVLSVAESCQVDEVIVALPVKGYDRFFRLLDGLQRLPASVRLIPEYVKETLICSRVEEFAGMPVITLQKPTLTPFERAVKRAFDLVAGLILFLLSVPILAAVAVAVRLDSPGPVFYLQPRVGENGKIFRMVKFRSMVEGAEEQQIEALRTIQQGQPVFEKLPDDPRVTRVGRFIRRMSLDELPQLLNVIKGDMSLVGPRPELPWLVEMTYQPWQWQRFSVPQGLTGWWQVNGRSDKPMYLHTEEDLFYIQNYSLMLDVQILFKTVGAILKRRGAY